MAAFHLSSSRSGFDYRVRKIPNIQSTIFFTEQTPSKGLCHCLRANNAFMITKFANINFICNRFINLNEAKSPLDFIYKTMETNLNEATLSQHCSNCVNNIRRGVEENVIGLILNDMHQNSISRHFNLSDKAISRRKLIFMKQHGLRTKQDLWFFNDMRFL